MGADEKNPARCRTAGLVAAALLAAALSCAALARGCAPAPAPGSDAGSRPAVPCFGPPAGDPPRFEDPEVTWDVQDGDGAHIRTLVWDEAARSWDELDITADGPEMEGRDGA